MGRAPSIHATKCATLGDRDGHVFDRSVGKGQFKAVDTRMASPTSMAVRLLPSTNGWLRMRASRSAAARCTKSGTEGCRQKSPAAAPGRTQEGQLPAGRGQPPSQPGRGHGPRRRHPRLARSPAGETLPRWSVLCNETIQALKPLVVRHGLSGLLLQQVAENGGEVSGGQRPEFAQEILARHAAIPPGRSYVTGQATAYGRRLPGSSRWSFWLSGTQVVSVKVRMFPRTPFTAAPVSRLKLQTSTSPGRPLRLKIIAHRIMPLNGSGRILPEARRPAPAPAGPPHR